MIGTIKISRTCPPQRHKFARPQDPQMLRHRGTANRESACDLARRAFLVPNQSQNPTACTVCQSTKRFIHPTECKHLLTDQSSQEFVISCALSGALLFLTQYVPWSITVSLIGRSVYVDISMTVPRSSLTGRSNSSKKKVTQQSQVAGILMVHGSCCREFMKKVTVYS